MRETLKEHQLIIDALKSRDGRMAGRMMREHISAVKKRMFDFLELPDSSGQNMTPGQG
jgi:DNA-binding GntR family transcriptional regulator